MNKARTLYDFRPSVYTLRIRLHRNNCYKVCFFLAHSCVCVSCARRYVIAETSQPIDRYTANLQFFLFITRSGWVSYASFKRSVYLSTCLTSKGASRFCRRNSKSGQWFHSSCMILIQYVLKMSVTKVVAQVLCQISHCPLECLFGHIKKKRRK